MTAKLEAVLIEDDREDAKFYKPIWQRILEKVWPEVRLNVQENFDDVSSFVDNRPHVAIVDNVLQTDKGERDNQGLALISQLKSEHEDTLFILFTRESFTIESLGYRTPNPDVIVTKTPLPNEDYENSIASQISERISRLPIRSIDFDSPDDLNEEELDLLTAQSLVEQCLYSLQAFRKEFGRSFDAIDKVRLSRLGGGRSGAGVFKCEILRKTSTNNSQFVFKYTNWEDIGGEIDNYHRHVRLQIPHHVRVDLVGVGRVGAYGAALYGFAFGGTEIVSSLTKPISEGRVEELFSFIDNVVCRDAIGWYQFKNDVLDVEEYFNNGLEYSPSKDSRRLEGLKHNLSDYFPGIDGKVTDRSVEFGEMSLDHVRNCLRKIRGENLPLFVSHGDLNSNNVMVFLGGSQFSLIDFEYTGLDTVYKDFVSLELSLRLYFPSEPDTDNIQLWLSAESDLVDALEENTHNDFAYLPEDARELYENVLKLRIKAKEFIEGRKAQFSTAQYEYALAFHLFKVAALPDWGKLEFPRLFFSYLASLDALSRY
ncbi:phosphotransferase [Ruegeria sp. HKCCA5014]|uniref:phosphotransferase n=1 Tax=Ruegeria sp. HKCCA5014 TaxID=2682980 RepID=UPI0014899435|nr:phosphotransferase [Ruegeria sp. HKCCA5014]